MNFFLYVNFCIYVIGSVPIESPDPYSSAYGGQVPAQAVNSRDVTLVCLQALKSSADLGRPTPLQTELVFSIYRSLLEVIGRPHLEGAVAFQRLSSFGPPWHPDSSACPSVCLLNLACC